MLVTTRRSSAMSSTDVVVTAFCSIRAVGSASNAFVRRSTRSGARSRGMGHSFELLGIPASYAAQPAPTRPRPHPSERPATRVRPGRSHALGDDLDRDDAGIRLRGSPDLVGGEGPGDERRVGAEVDDRPRRRLTGHGLRARPAVGRARSAGSTHPRCGGSCGRPTRSAPRRPRCRRAATRRAAGARRHGRRSAGPSSP